MARISVFAGAAIAAAFCALAAAQSSEPGFVNGKVVDRSGAPLAGVQVFIDGIGDNNMQVTTKADGTYRMRLTAGGAYKVSASMEREYNGQVYKIELKPEEVDTFSTDDGAVRNFVWALNGRKPLPMMGEYGGFAYVDVRSDDYFLEDPQNIVYVLKPVGPLIDGGAGETLTLRSGAPRKQGYGQINDIPIGRYEITATYTPPGKEPQKLRIRDSYNEGDYAEMIVFGFEPQGNFCDNCAHLQVEAPKQDAPQEE